MKKADIDGTFTKDDVMIVFNVDNNPKATYFSETGNGRFATFNFV